MSDLQPIKRKRGGQPGNINALKTGRYRAKEQTQPVHTDALDQINEVDQLIYAVKRQMERTYQSGLQAADLQETLKTMNSLSLAAIGLCRLLKTHIALESPDSTMRALLKRLEVNNASEDRIIDFLTQKAA